jgi:hypothetical protein
LHDTSACGIVSNIQKLFVIFQNDNIQSTSIDWLKPALTTGSVNTSIDRFLANPGLFGTKEKSLSDN